MLVKCSKACLYSVVLKHTGQDSQLYKGSQAETLVNTMEPSTGAVLEAWDEWDHIDRPESGKVIDVGGRHYAIFKVVGDGEDASSTLQVFFIVSTALDNPEVRCTIRFILYPNCAVAVGKVLEASDLALSLSVSVRLFLNVCLTPKQSGRPASHVAGVLFAPSPDLDGIANYLNVPRISKSPAGVAWVTQVGSTYAFHLCGLPHPVIAFTANSLQVATRTNALPTLVIPWRDHDPVRDGLMALTVTPAYWFRLPEWAGIPDNLRPPIVPLIGIADERSQYIPTREIADRPGPLIVMGAPVCEDTDLDTSPEHVWGTVLEQWYRGHVLPKLLQPQQHRCMPMLECARLEKANLSSAASFRHAFLTSGYTSIEVLMHCTGDKGLALSLRQILVDRTLERVRHWSECAMHVAPDTIPSLCANFRKVILATYATADTSRQTAMGVDPADLAALVQHTEGRTLGDMF